MCVVAELVNAVGFLLRDNCAIVKFGPRWALLGCQIAISASFQGTFCKSLDPSQKGFHGTIVMYL